MLARAWGGERETNRWVDFVMLHFHFLVLIATLAKDAVVQTERTVQPETTVQNIWYGGR
jgi:hypothetical protein